MGLFSILKKYKKSICNCCVLKEKMDRTHFF